MPLQDRNNKRYQIRKAPPTVKEFRDVLAAARHVLAVRAPSGDSLVEVIKEIEGALAQNSLQPASEIVIAIRRHFVAVAGTSAVSEYPTAEEISPSTPLETIKQCLVGPGASKQRLIAIAQGRFGIPRGRLLKLSKDGIREEIDAAILSIEGYDIIGRVASDNRRDN